MCVVEGCSSGLGLEHIFVSVCMERVHLSVCGFKCLVLDVARFACDSAAQCVCARFNDCE